MKTSPLAEFTTFSEDLDRVYLELLKTRAPFEQHRLELSKLEKNWLRRAGTETQRLSVKRTVASTLLTEAYGAKRPWKDFGAYLRRLQRLGFVDLAMRVHVSCLFLQSTHRYPKPQTRAAWGMWDDTERRVRRLRRESLLREEHLESLAHALKVAQVVRPLAR